MVFHEIADMEFIDTIGYYRDIRHALAESFSNAVREAVTSLAAQPLAGTRLNSRTTELRWWPVRKFPYSIIYRVLESRLVVIAVSHEKHRPNYWRRRVI